MSDTATLQDHGERIARLEQIADDTRRALDRIEAGLGKLDTGLNQRIDGLNQRIDKLDTGLNQRIDSLGERLDRRIDSLGERLDRRIDSLTRWSIGLLFTLALTMAGGFAALYQVIARLQLPHS